MTTPQDKPKLLDPVALLAPQAEAGLQRGQVGTIVEILDANTALVEFSDDGGLGYAIFPCRLADLLVLRVQPEPA